MGNFRSELRKAERAVEKLTGSRRQAATFRRQVEKKVQSKLQEVVRRKTREKTLRPMGLRQTGGTRLRQVAFRPSGATGPQLAASASEQQIIKKLVATKRAGWVNHPDSKTDAVLVEHGTGCVVKDASGKPVSQPKSTRSSKPDINRNDFLQHLKSTGIEEYVPHMYLDRDGRVTVGIGHLIPDADAATRLDFTSRDPIKPVIDRHTINAFNKVKKSGLKGAAAPSFKNLTHIFISEPDAVVLALKDMDNFLNIIRSSSYFPEFDSYPVLAKMGLLDLVYNAGALGTRDGYPRTTAAVRRRNWKQAGVEQRDGRTSSRADIAQAWFNRAAQQEPFFISHTNCHKSLAQLAIR